MSKQSDNNETNNSINDADQRLLEAYYKRIGEAHISNILQDLDNRKDEIKNVEISDAFHNRMMAFINMKKKEENRKKRIKRIKRISSRVAIILLTLSVAFTVCTLSVEAFRVKVFNLFQDTKDNYTEVKAEEEIDQEVKGYYYPNYLPEGFTVENNKDLKSIRIIHFAKDDEIITFIQAQNESSFHLDTENAEVSDLFVNGNAGLLIIIKDKTTTVFWNNNEMSFSISGYINKEEIIKIAENIEKK
jgi:intracellular sulfur oxidation DsrE/DsrF family protein